jgi:hypothetical protein
MQHLQYQSRYIVCLTAGYYQQARAKTLGMRPLQTHCHYGLGRMCHQTDRAAPARTALAAAIDLYRAKENLPLSP